MCERGRRVMSARWDAELCKHRLRQTRRWRALAAACGVLLGVSLAAGCHPQTGLRAQPVGVRLPDAVLTQVHNAQTSLVGALSQMSMRYDQQVCDADEVNGKHAFGRQALAEANLEVDRALSQARNIARARGGGPPEASSGITYIEEDAAPEQAWGAWICVQADEQPACVQASANNLAQQVFRTYVAGYELNPVTVANVLDAFAAEVRWADARLTRAPTRTSALQAIEQDCRAGESPLAQFFDAAEALNQVQLREQLLLVRAGFVDAQPDVCAALPAFYDQLLQQLGTSLARRTRTQFCAIESWEAVP